MTAAVLSTLILATVALALALRADIHRWLYARLREALDRPDYAPLPAPDDAAPLAAPALDLVSVDTGRRYALLCPPADPEVWTDPESLRYREDLHQEVAEVEMQWAAQADDIARLHREFEEWLAKAHEQARQRLQLTGGAR